MTIDADPWRLWAAALVFPRPGRMIARSDLARASCRTETMANTASAKKAARVIARRTTVNQARRSRVRTFLRKLEEAIATGDKTAATAALKAAEPEIMRASQKGVIHKNTASRKVSRLASRVAKIGA